MSYLRKKLQAIMACADFKGYLREVTGTDSVTLTDCMGSDMTSLSLVGNTVQDGTPSPDNPVEVQGCGERTRNLLDITQVSGPLLEVKDNKIYLSGYNCNTNISPEVFLEMTGLSIGDTITATHSTKVINGTGNSIFGRVMFLNRVTTGTSFVLKSNTPVTIPEDFNSSNYHGLYLYGVNQADESGERLAVMSDFAIYKGSYTAETMPPFEPYGYKVPVEVSGRNLFDVSLKYSTPWLSAVIDDSGWVTYDYANPNDTTIYPAFFTHASAEIRPDTKYTVITEIESISGCRFDPTSIRAAGDMYQGQLQNSQNYYETAGTYVLSANSLSDLSGANCFLTTKLVVAANATAHIKFRLSVLEGTYTAATIPPYEPYHAPQTFNVYMDKPLYATGDVGDEITLDFEHKTATRTDKIKQLKDFEVSHCAGIPRQTEQCIHLSNNNVDDDGVDGSPILSTHFVNVIWVPVSTDAQNEGVAWYPSGYNHIFYIYLNKTRIDMTADDTTATLATKCNAYIQTLTGREVYYQLLTPATTDISAMQDWDTIPKLWRGTAIATVKTTVPTKAITARYYAVKKED